MEGVKVAIVEIGKKEANEFLDRNTKNRRASTANYEFIKKQILNDEFVLNGSTVVISESGILLDGQHRLMALSETDKKISVILVENVPDSVMPTIDTGKTRRASDVLSMNGYAYSASLASTIRLVVEEFGNNRGIMNSGSKSANKLTNNDYLREVENDMYMDSFEKVRIWYDAGGNTKTISASFGAAFLVLLSREDSQKANSFIRELYTGRREHESNAAQYVRNKIINDRIRGFRMREDSVRDLVVAGFRRYLKNDTVVSLKPRKAMFISK